MDSQVSSRLTIVERIQLVDDLWDSIAAEMMEDPGLLPPSDTRLNEINRRWNKYRQYPHDTIPSDEAMNRTTTPSLSDTR